MVTDRGPTARLAYLDNLKWVLIAAIIVEHAADGYGALGAGAWFYVEPSLSPVSKTVLSVLIDIGGLFALGTFMLVAGLLTPPSLARKGSGKFLRDRLLRLGLPFVASLAVITPAVLWLIVAVTGYPATLADIVKWQLQHLDPGPMWFVAVLVLFTIGYVGWRWIRPAKKAAARPLQMRHLLVAAALIATLDFPVRLIFPIGSVQVLQLHLWEWPQLVVPFALGVVARERGWLSERPSTLIRRACWLAPLAAVAVLGLMILAYGSGSASDLAGGWRWQTAALGIVEGVLAVGLSLALIDVFRQIGNWSGRLVGALSRDSYAAYFLQTPVLVALELALFHFVWPGEIKLALVAPAAIVISFALAWAIRCVYAAAGRPRWTTSAAAHHQSTRQALSPKRRLPIGPNAHADARGRWS